MSYIEPDVYLNTDASGAVPTELAAGGNLLILGTANKGALNTATLVNPSTFIRSDKAEEASFGSIGTSSDANALSLVRACYYATKDSNADVWAVRVATNAAAQGSGTLEDVDSDWGIDLTSYYKGEWYHGTVELVSGIKDSSKVKLLIQGSSLTNYAGWSEWWDGIDQSSMTASGLVELINGRYTTSPTDIEYGNISTDVGGGKHAYTTVNGNITPSVQGSVFFTAAVSSGAAEVLTDVTETADVIEGADDGEVVTAVDIETVHRTFFAQKNIYDVLHFAGLTCTDITTYMNTALDNAANERCWRIGVQGVAESETDTAPATVTAWVANTTTHNDGYYIKWGSRWKEVPYDPWESANTIIGAPQTITIDSKWTAAWYAGMMVSPNANGIVDESIPMTGLIVPNKAKYNFNRSQRKSLINSKITFTNYMDLNNSFIVRGQTAYGIDAEAAAWRNESVVRLVNQLKKDIVKVAKRFTVQQKNLARSRTSLKSAIKKVLDNKIASEKLVSYRGLKVYASRQDQLDGIVKVDFTIEPVQPVLFIVVNMILE